jgi:hypothetical protein
MADHSREAGVDLAILAASDSVDRRAHIVVDAAPGNTPTVPAGWTQIAEIIQGTRNIYLLTKTLTKVLGSTLWSWSGSHQQAVVVKVYRGVQEPTADQVLSNMEQNTTHVDFLSVTSALDGTLWAFGGFASGGNELQDISNLDNRRFGKAAGSANWYKTGDKAHETAQTTQHRLIASPSNITGFLIGVAVALRSVEATTVEGVLADMDGAAITDMNGDTMLEAA